MLVKFRIDTLFPDHAGQFSVDRVESLKQPRTVKTHLSYDMLPHEVKEKAKVRKDTQRFKKKLYR